MTISPRLMIRLAIAAGTLLAFAIVLLSLPPAGDASTRDTHSIAQTALTPAPTAQPAMLQAPAPQPRAASLNTSNPDAMTLKRVLVIDHPFGHGDYVWDDKGVPAGKVIITIDLKAQTLAVFRDGYQIGAAVILYGADNMQTPLGTFHITQKDADHFSSTYNHAPMPYMLRLTNDGVSIHGSSVELGNATHGCIGVPVPFARLLFKQARLGTPVIITSGKMMAVPQGTQMTQVAERD